MLAKHSSVSLPVIEEVSIRGYQLYPGPARRGLSWTFKPGLSVIAGINGLGKTTLLKILFRTILGTRDLQKADTHDLGSGKADLARERLNREFAQRVPDFAESAQVTVRFRLAKTQIVVARDLATMKLLKFKVGRLEKAKPDEGSFEEVYLEEVAALAGVESPYEFHILVRFLLFFMEDREALLWNQKSQFELLRMLFVNRPLAKKCLNKLQSVRELDTNYGNARWQFNQRLQELEQIQQAQNAQSETVSGLSHWSSIREAAEAAVNEHERAYSDLRAELEDLEEQDLRLQHTLSGLERTFTAKQTEYLSRLFPSVSETALHVVGNMVNGAGCIVCGDAAADTVKRFRAALKDNECPVCNAQVTIQAKPLDGAATKTLNELSHTIKLERKSLGATKRHLEDVRLKFAGVDDALRTALQERAVANRRLELLQSQVASDTDANVAASLVREEERRVQSMKSKLDAAVKEYRALVKLADGDLEALKSKIVRAFKVYATAFLAEDVSLKYERIPVELGTRTGRVSVPSFTVEMTSGAHPRNRKPRKDDTEVSESQKEFLDLAFRMALIRALVGDAGDAMLVMETPEASLDSVFIGNAAKMLRLFAETGAQRRVIVTCNLTGPHVIRALLGLTQKNTGSARVNEHVFNLLRYAAPSAAYRKHRNRYDELFKKIVG